MLRPPDPQPQLEGWPSSSLAATVVSATGGTSRRSLSRLAVQVPRPVSVPLLGAERAPEAGKVQKPRIWFGYLPLWSEWLPTDPSTGCTDWSSVAANCGAGIIIGVREALGGIVSASLVFSSTNVKELMAIFPLGVSLMWYTTAAGVLWYAVFGRLQYGYGTSQDVIGILQAEMARQAAESLIDKPEAVPATVICIISLSAVLNGFASLVLGKLGLGKFFLLFPSTVIGGFLGAIGVVILRTSLQTASGVKFRWFYPVDVNSFFERGSIAQVGCQILMVLLIRFGPAWWRRRFPKSAVVQHLSGLVCQLFPLGIFYVVLLALGLDTEELSRSGWMYPKQPSDGMLSLWQMKRWSAADPWVVIASLNAMPPLVMMAVLCSMTGALSITDRFPTGPPGDPAPMELIDLDSELATVGAGSMFLGLTGGSVNFHSLTAIQLRLDGGTHRIAVLAVACTVGAALFSGAPIGHYIPKWYLAGLFMNTAIHFLKGAIFSYRSLPTVGWFGREHWQLPSPQYFVSLCGPLVAVFFSPATAIGTGLVLSVALFLLQSSRANPVSNVVVGNRVVSRLKRPYWEMRTLRREGDRIMLIYLQGQLFFGSARRLVDTMAAAAAGGHVQFCILSFARVPQVDPSAARHLKTAADKLHQRGCQVICCRTSRKVFKALCAVELIVSPDPDLISHLEGVRWRSRDASGKPSQPQRLSVPLSPSISARFGRQRHASGCLEQLDAFAHETDALDYCDEHVVARFCYSTTSKVPQQALEKYMLAYRAATSDPDARLDEWAFEEMHGFPAGFMGRLRPFCDVRTNVPSWTELGDVHLRGALGFIFQGAVSFVQMVPQAEEVSSLNPEVRGFSFRQGKHLRKRYPPGNIVGKHAFFLKPKDKVIDADAAPKAIVSSKFSSHAEVWILHHEQWDRLPEDIRGPLMEALCMQLADDDQHAIFQEH